MIIRINQLKASLEYTPAAIDDAVGRKLGVSPEQLGKISVVRRSIDARSAGKPPGYSLTLDVEFTGKLRPWWRKNPDLSFPEPAPEYLPARYPPPAPMHPRPVVVGAGPAGLMAALVLARAGLNPLLIERGDAVEERAGKVNRFWTDGTLNPQSNALFGEGGAGLFSDGKLTSRSKDRPRTRFFFETLVEAGAPEEILIDAMPHVGSDRLLRIIPKLRDMITTCGGEVRFNQCLENIRTENGRLRSLVVSGQTIPCTRCVLAIGHSARDTVKMLHAGGVALAPKSFAVGVRLELPQMEINRSQWGRWHDHPCLGAASFKLTRLEEAGVRACYSFCMCPGGTVIACTSEPGMLTTNGMSLHRRGKPYGNAAFLVPVEPEDYLQLSPNNPLAGFLFQEKLERAAWSAGGENFSLPAADLNDFLRTAHPRSIPENRSCPRAVPVDLNQILPDFISATLRHTLPLMIRKLENVDPASALLYGTETRSSSPVRIERGATLESLSCAGIYPCGEGAGYAGGIVSSGIDGIKTAEAVLQAAL